VQSGSISTSIWRWVMAVGCLVLLAGAQRVAAADLDTAAAETLLGAGKYEEVVAKAREQLASAESLDWRTLLIRGLSATGEREAAADAARALLARHPNHLHLLALAHAAFRDAGDGDGAAAVLRQMRAASNTPGSVIDDPADLVAAGQVALLAGDEPKAVLRLYFDKALERDPKNKAAFLAGGELALAKGDDRLAADWFARGLAKLGADADLHAGLARAHYEGDREAMMNAIAAALHRNPRHVPALLLRAEHEIDGEDHVAARKTIDQVLAIDPRAPAAWAFRAVLAHLGNDRAAEQRARQQALSPWKNNPAVDTLIGRKLAQQYRFVEGAAYQRRALAIAPDHLPAKAQLAQDLLRLGSVQDNQAGWALAAEVHRRDRYDVTAYNLVTLHDHMGKFVSLSSPRASRAGFTVRMDAREAPIYGDEVLDLLDEASAKLDHAYGFVRKGPVAVEIFPDQRDFAVRTFGLPGQSGYLGVCFGPLITMNSPAGTGAAPVSWRSVLWHEYTHVITLGLTGNRIPRWLSEGISVHEELRHDPTWGQRMTPRYREMIEAGELLPMGKLSSAFIAPKTPEHVMFAYYQSALAVDFLVATYGQGALNAILGDLGRGIAINDALGARAAPMAELDRGFLAFAQQRKSELPAAADFRAPAPALLAEGDGQDDDAAKRLRAFVAQHPNNVPALLADARGQMRRGAWAEARRSLERLVALAPDDVDGDSPRALLAEVLRHLGATDDERKVLEQLAARSSGSAPTYRRLIEISETRGDFAALGTNADRLLAVNPMLELGWRARARALEHAAAQDPAAVSGAIKAYERLLLLEPADRADTHLRLGQLLAGRDRRAAKRHVMEALAEAPRLLAGHRLLLELAGATRGAEP
jgi:Tfp pilus assembly protein PilF